MGLQVMLYRWRKIARQAEATDEVDYYQDLTPLYAPRPCYCEWSVLKDRLFGRPNGLDIPGFACACSGEVPFYVPGYRGRWGQGNDTLMREFAQKQEIRDAPWPTQ